ncbi:hypothetical protein COCNU_02G003050 [Cocos nucifera]|uniref:Uncharacterized protein n=1 Tax=Cocos nucifera TaxID=13894 RepID=A0A8K0MWF2_COCNU|nr:hypothetical protein COCNU_02G003050 [Cocos nucifera]
MTPAKIPVIFFAISFLLLLSLGGSVPNEDIFPFSTADSKQDPPEITDRTATVIPLEKSLEGSISAAVEPFHRVDLSLRRPIDRQIRRPINPHFPLRLRRGCRGHHHGRPGGREIPYGDDMIGFPRGPKLERGFPGEMRSIPMRGPRIPRGFPGEMRSIPMRGPRIPREFPGEMLPISRRPEFQSGFWKERAAMVHGMREAEGREVSMEEKVREKREEEGEDGDLVKRIWSIFNRF